MNNTLYYNISQCPSPAVKIEALMKVCFNYITLPLLLTDYITSNCSPQNALNVQLSGNIPKLQSEMDSPAFRRRTTCDAGNENLS